MEQPKRQRRRGLEIAENLYTINKITKILNQDSTLR